MNLIFHSKRCIPRVFSLFRSQIVLPPMVYRKYATFTLIRSNMDSEITKFGLSMRSRGWVVCPFVGGDKRVQRCTNGELGVL